MKKTLFSLLAASALFAADPRIGTWKAISSNEVQDAPEKITFTTQADSIHVRTTTGAEWTAKPDGNFYPAKGDPQFDQIAVHRTAPDKFDGIRRKSGRRDVAVEYKVTDERRTLVFTRPGFESVWRRTGGTKDPENPFVGEWTIDLKESIRRSPAEVVTFTPDGANGVHLHSSHGLDYRAQLDGKEYALKNSRDDSISVRVVDSHTVEEAWMRKGQLGDSIRWKLSKDGQELTQTDHAVLPDGRKMTLKTIFHKQ